jgi:type VI secretion system lysozyme-like protein
MASPTPHLRIVPSLLDRCLADRAEETPAQRSWRYQTLPDALATVARDLEALFTTRQTPACTLPPDKELLNSLLTYGLPNLTRFGQNDTRICQAIEDAIKRFEPRLEQVRVVPGIRSQGGLILHIHIAAILRLPVEPAPTWELPGESVSFAATLSLSPQQCTIQGEIACP